MPREGQATVTIPEYVWEKAETYYKKHSKQLKKKGIHSASKLIQVWIEQNTSQE